MKGKGYTNLTIPQARQLLAENRRARAFYERAGFHPDGAAMETVIGGKPLEELRYRRRIL